LDSGEYGLLGKVFSIRDTYRHPDESQIWTTTGAPRSFLLEPAEGKSEEQS